MTETLANTLERGLAAHPDAIAVHGGGRLLTFRQLDETSGAIAAHLVEELGVRPGDRILFLAEKSPELIAAAIATWRASAIYVPVDAENPRERLGQIVETIRPALIVSGERRLGELDPAFRGIRSLSYQAIGTLPPRPAPATAVDPASVAVIIHTSGSTGTPKGAMLSHESVVTYFGNHNEFLAFSPASRGMNNGPFHFDVSLQDTFLPLFFGASVLLHGDLFVSSVMLQLLEQNHITHLIAVSSVLDLISRDATRMVGIKDSALHTVVTGGEICDPKLIARWLAAVPGLRVLHGYGPTECNSLCTTYVIRERDEQRTALYPIGKPFRGVKAVLLDGEGGVIERAQTTGVLALAGPQLMMGYWGDPQRTREVLRRIGDDDYYVTGDHCYRDEAGDYFFVGRRDMEVKIRGRRINLSEVRDALLSHRQVSFAAVTTMTVEDEARIVAVAQVDDPTSFSFAELEEQLRLRVPGYMLPAHIGIAREVHRTGTDKISERLALDLLTRTVLANPLRRHLVLSS